MKKFEDFDELKNVYESGKYDIFYEKDEVKYQVDNIGSTIYCRHMDKRMGMGAITNFPIQYFYGELKPEPVKQEDAKDTSVLESVN